MCPDVWAAVREGDLANSLHSPGSGCRQLPHGCHMGPDEKSRGACQGGPSRGFLPCSAVPWTCQVPRVSKLGKHFQSKAFALLGRLLKAASLSLRLGDPVKSAFCSCFSMGTSSGSLLEARMVWAGGHLRQGHLGGQQEEAGQAAKGRSGELNQEGPRMEGGWKTWKLLTGIVFKTRETLPNRYY